MKSWKTSLGGAMAAVGGVLAGASVLTQFSGAPEYAKVVCWWLILVGFLMTAFGAGFGLLFARDNDVTSEDVKKNIETRCERKAAVKDWLGGKDVLLILTGLLAIGTVACIPPSRIAPGADPVVVQAEQLAKNATDTIDAFLQWETRNQAIVHSDIRAAADLAREFGPTYVRQLRSATKTYKAARNPDNLNDVNAAIVTLQQLLDQIREHYTKAQPL